jgi:alginate O-acetyltransferase complex protein AlgI
MVFSSSIFLFLYLPIFLAIYYLTPFRFRSIVILLGSYIFYAWWRVDFLLLFFGVTVWCHYIAKFIVKYLDTNPLWAKRIMQLGCGLNLLTLGYFKYWNFGVASFQAILVQTGLAAPDAVASPMVQMILPIGISFYVFHGISFMIDVFRRDAPPAKNFWDFAAFIALFPQLVAGPVLRYKDLADQFTQRTHTWQKFSNGAHRFMLGFAKKVLIADVVAHLADHAFALDNPTLVDSWLGITAYAIQLYFDFSGYSDMAVGLGLMIGFKFIENFNHPYISRSMTEFWRRWHISLSSWLKDYLYIPLGGNRKGEIRTYVNLFLTMLLGGWWHGANWTFVLWGVWHGGWLAIERALGVNPKHEKTHLLKDGSRMIFTLFLVLMGWVTFRAANIDSAFTMYKALFNLSNIGLSDAMRFAVNGWDVTMLVTAIILTFAVPAWQKFGNRPSFMTLDPDTTYYSLGYRLVGIVLFVLAVMRLQAQSFSPFLYFQF